MAAGEWLLLAAVAVAGAALASAVLHVLRGGAGPERRAVLLGVAAAALAGVAYLVLLGHFLARDYSIYYVWNYSDDATPLYLRAAGVWAGAAGSVFLWTVLIGAVFVLEEAMRRRALARGLHALTPRAAGVVRATVLGVFVVFLLLTLAARPFAPTEAFHFDAATGFFTYQPGASQLPDPLDFRPEGFGLNPLLVTPFMAIHPPAEFIAYASATMPFAFAVAALATRDPRWWDGALLWGRVAWLFYAAALGLGALWAYYVLSFGGYWAWDPVEVGALIPFLGLTAFLHAVDMHRKGKGYPHYAPFLAGLAFPLTLFGTFVTRSSYWISAHAFDVGAAAIVNDPAQRLVAIVASKAQVAQVLTLLFVALGLLAALHLARFARAMWARKRTALSLPALAVLGAWLALTLFAALDVEGFLRQGFGLAGLLGGGNLLLGLALLGLALVALPVALMVLSIEEEGEPQPLDPEALLRSDALMSGGVILLSLGLLVTVALLLIGVNSTVTGLGDLFRAREPLVVLPLVLVLTLRLTVKSLGPRRSLALALGAAALGALLYLLLPAELRLLGLGVPILSVALGAALNQMVMAAAKTSTAPPDARRAGALVLLSSVAGFAMWASPPTSLALAGAVVPVPLAAVPVGLGAAMASFVLGVALVQGENRRVAVPAGLAAVLSVGYGVGVVLGLAALVLAHRARRRLAPPRPLRASLRAHAGRLHATSRWAAHVGFLLIVAGYGASAYHATEADWRDLSDPLERGVPRAFEGYTLTLADSRGVDHDGDGQFEEVVAFVAVARDGAVLDVAPLRFYWVEKESQYRASEHVVRTPLEDVYLNSDPANLPAMHTEQDGWVVSNQRALFDLQGGQGQMRSDQVDKVSFSVKLLPLVAPLWAGAALLPFTMAVTLATAPPRGRTGTPGGVKAQAAPRAVPAAAAERPSR